MLEVNVTIKCPDLVLAATALAAALGKKPAEAAAVPQQIAAPARASMVLTPAAPAPVVLTPAAPAPVVTAPAPVVTAPTAPLVPAPVAPVVPTPAPMAAPTAAPTYTLAQVATAGATLMSQHPETQEALMGLLGQFGIKAVSELKPDQLPAFAAELRRLGAKL